MLLYHGSYLGGLSVIAANSRSHTTGKPVAYFTESRAYALVCCRPPEENFVTAGIRQDGKLHYFERFPNQLKVMYDGKVGYLYTVRLTNGMTPASKPQAYESSTDVPVLSCERIENVYEALLEEMRCGTMILHRYEDIDPAEQKEMAVYIRESFLNDPMSEPYRAFWIEHFRDWWD
ncbi:MAG: hypothetical protein II412_09165 [Clostridia bacterium]|nr:hypothetical protein [Clostridia bacterium]